MPTPRVGILWRGDAHAPAPPPEETRLRRVFETLAERGAAPEPVVYADDAVDAVREQLLALDAVLVWVDPVVAGQDRSRLDPLLREVASRGVWVSAHPDVILKMGTKDVLVATRAMAWGSDCHHFRTVDELRAELPALLVDGPRVLKQVRGSQGNGVWKVESPDGRAPAGDSTVQVLHAARGSSLEDMTFDAFVERCAPYFAGGAAMIDQPYQARLAEGMVRVYFVRDRVVGFGQHFVTALLPPPPGTRETPPAPPRVYFGPDRPEFQRLRALMEGGWVAELQAATGVDDAELPAIWDADFLYGPKTPSGEDTYVLCEINVSGVFPVPEESFAPLADEVVRTLSARR